MGSVTSNIVRVFLSLGVLFVVACSGSGEPDITLTDREIEPEAGNAAPETDGRPNIVLVVSDDQRWDLLSARGHEFVKTPHLDAITESGSMMENAFVPVALCSPSRAALWQSGTARLRGGSHDRRAPTPGCQDVVTVPSRSTP